MKRRADIFASQEYPYGSEFAFDTTGQEEVVVWLMEFASASNNYTERAKMTVNHILSYMRSSRYIFVCHLCEWHIHCKGLLNVSELYC